MKFFCVTLLVVLALTSCRSKSETHISIPKGRKLVNFTRSGENIDYETRPMTDADIAESYAFPYGMLGKVHVIHESK